MSSKKRKGPSKKILAAQNAALGALLHGLLAALMEGKTSDERAAFTGRLRREADIELLRAHMDEEEQGAAARIMTDALLI